MKLQQLLSYARRAIDDYQMLQNGDRVAIGISGGKDSLALLYAMAELRRFYPVKYELVAITVDLGFHGFDTSVLGTFCEQLNVPYTVVKTDIAQVVFDVRKEENQCSLCAKMRKGAFNDAANKLQCNKSAYAHHKDDVMETSLLSLIYEGQYHTFAPITYLDRSDITLIRPLIYVEEKDIITFRDLYQLPVCKNPCTVDGYTKREYIKRLIKQLETENPGTRERLFHAITCGLLPTWRKPDHQNNIEEP